MPAHKHAELIRAWADGAKIQVFKRDEYWADVGTCPSWLDNQYRIKPEPKPDFVCLASELSPRKLDEIRVTLDGETHKLKSVELI